MKLLREGKLQHLYILFLHVMLCGNLLAGSIPIHPSKPNADITWIFHLPLPKAQLITITPLFLYLVLLHLLPRLTIDFCSVVKKISTDVLLANKDI